MNNFKIKLDEDTYQHLKTKFKGDPKAINKFVNETLANELAMVSNNKSKTVKKNNNNDLKEFLKSSKSGSRSYGIKGQGW